MIPDTLRAACFRLALTVVAVALVAAAPPPAAGPARSVDFARDIRPILADACFHCHGPDEETRKAKLRLDMRSAVFAPRGEGPIVQPHQPDASALIQRITAADPDERMPPAESHRQLTPAEIELLRQWIRHGAAWEDHWAFAPPVRPAIPALAQPVEHPIDAFVLAGLRDRHLTLQPEASPEVLARRLTLDLTGLPPTPAEIDAFVADHRQRGGAAVEALVDRLLASRRYGVHWAWMWMDAARYADTNGYQGDSERAMWRWRDWLVDALNANLPFSNMTVQMLAGDLLTREQNRSPDWDSGAILSDPQTTRMVMATGFLRNHRFDTGSGTIPDESRFENAADRMETTATVFMGLTMQCARCHTHKFDPITNREYYQLLSFFDRVREYGSAIRPNSHPYIITPLDEAWGEIQRLDADCAAARKALEDAEPHIAAAQRQWERSIEQPAEAPRVAHGLKFHFPLDEPSEPLKLTAGEVRFTDAVRTRGMLFDGQTRLQGPQAAGQMCAGSKRWTLALWLRVDEAGDQSILSVVEKPDTDRKGLQIDVLGGRLRLRHVCRWNHSYIEFTSSQPITPGVWHHVALVSDGRQQGIGYRAYLDGDSSGFAMTHETTNDDAGGSGKAPLVLGGGPYLPGFRGAMADLRFYDRDVALEEISLLAERRTLAELAAAPHRTPRDAAVLRYAFLEHGAPQAMRDLQQALRDALERRRAFLAGQPTTMVMQDRLPPATHMRIKGAYDKRGEPVSAGVPSILPPLPRDQPADRLTLARWLVSGQHPLTARVAVNRIWQQLFGRGFVDSPENFGMQCAQPLHVGLLDFLASEYVRLGWDTKALIRFIVLSRTYRQCSAAPESLWSIDPENRLLARGPRHRLPFHVLRDQALAIGGILDESFTGPPTALYEPPARKDAPARLKPQPTPRCRTLYTHWKRNAAAPMLAVFDTADRNLCSVALRRTNTPLQALVTLNEPGLFVAAGAFARRVLAEAEPADDARLRFAHRWITGALPDASDLATLSAALIDHRRRFTVDRSAARELLASAQLQPADTDDPVELAAWTTLANTLLNLDRTLSKE